MISNRSVFMEITIWLFATFLLVPNAMAITITWTGATDNSWHKSCNWSPAQIPTNSDAVVINAVATYPDITATACASTVTINANVTAALQIQTAGTLRINGSILNVASSTTNALEVIGSGQINMGAAACTPTDLGGCCVNSTTALSASCTGNCSAGPKATSSTTITLAKSGGTLGTGASWEWYSGSCGGTTEGSGASITDFVTTSSCSGTNKTFYVRAEGTCNTTSCIQVTVQICYSSGTGCGGFSCNYGDNSCGQNQADGSCGINYVPLWSCPGSPTCGQIFTSGCAASCKPCDPSKTRGAPSRVCSGANMVETWPLSGGGSGWIVKNTYSASTSDCTYSQDYAYACGSCVKTYYNYQASGYNCYGSCAVPSNCSGSDNCSPGAKYNGITGCMYL